MCKENMYNVYLGSQDSHAVYSVDMQIMRIKVSKSLSDATADRDNINFTYHVVYFIMH